MCAGLAGGSGGWRTRRSRVVGLVGNPRSWLRRAPASPPRACPTFCKIVVSRVVRRADGWVSVGTRSVKIRRGQAGLAQKKRRVRKVKRTAIVAEGVSASVR